MVIPEREPAASQRGCQKPAEIVICGGGIVGLVLALALKKHLGVKAEIYEAATKFADDVGAGMGMYPNGLRVLRDIDPALLSAVRNAGHPYLYRRWERHDGTEVAVASEGVLSECSEELQSIGIRRWRLQRVLYNAVLREDIPIYFGKRARGVEQGSREDGLVEMIFEDGTRRLARVLFGADGSRSKVREIMASGDKSCASDLRYTGVTCIMGMADLPRPARGICFPSASTTKCHACFFPTQEKEQCFQFHFPVPAEHADEGSWGNLSKEVGREECRKLADRLRKDGWDERYLAPLGRVTHAVRIGFCSLEPGLKRLVYGPCGRIALLGDAAHPPVPYLGQGAQMGIEDAGVIAVLLKNLCVDGGGAFNLANFGTAMRIYEDMRVPRTADILAKSNMMGNMQQKRAVNRKYDQVKEELIQRDIFFHETVPVMLPGATYDYQEDVMKVLQAHPALLPIATKE